MAPMSSLSISPDIHEFNPYSLFKQQKARLFLQQIGVREDEGLSVHVHVGQSKAVPKRAFLGRVRLRLARLNVIRH